MNGNAETSNGQQNINMMSADYATGIINPSVDHQQPQHMVLENQQYSYATVGFYGYEQPAPNQYQYIQQQQQQYGDLANAVGQMSIQHNNPPTTLNPHAAVFRPRQHELMSYQYQPMAPQVDIITNVCYDGYDQNLEAEYTEQARAAAAYSCSTQLDIPVELQTAMISGQNAALLQEVQVGLEQLIAEPDELESWGSAISDRLNDKSMTEQGLLTATDLILHAATSTGQLQGICARLCAYLTDKVVDFRLKYLLNKLRDLHEERHLLPLQKRQYLAMFFAELIVHVINETGSRMEVVCFALFEQIKDLLEIISNESDLKCIAQLLKCCGTALEEVETGRDLMQKKIIEPLRIIMQRETTTPIMKHQIDSIFEHRASANYAALHMGPDGQPLSDEERQFLEDHCSRLDSLNNYSSESEVDPEMLADYEEFLASQH